MRFINTRTLKFEYIPDSQLDLENNKYAILSHRWSATPTDEISFADINESKDPSQKKGFPKLRGFCNLASKLGYHYGWDDTCCINKGDSSEMSEAINSMYAWYQRSSICVVYLEDVPTKSFVSSEWFDRGWTLQELIGPATANFYDRDWNLIGTKSSLSTELSNKTGIPNAILSHAASPSTCSIAQRMSWAAHRKTTRIEDRAYSLLGIFGVNMPQIYGEREAAFLRLQRAIIQQSKDESIFAWSMGESNNKQSYTGLFGPSPSSFSDCSDVIMTRGSQGFAEKNGELTITLETFPYSMETYGAILNCTRKGNPDERFAILISTLSTENEYIREKKKAFGGKLLITPSRLEFLKERLIRVCFQPPEAPLNQAYGFWLRTISPPDYTECETKTLSRSPQPSEDIVNLEEGETGTAGIIYLCPKTVLTKKYGSDEKGWSKIRWIKLGFDGDFNPVLYIANDKRQDLLGKTRIDRDKPNWEIFEEAIVSGPESQAHVDLMNNRWILDQAGVPSRLYGWPQGISILKVDKKVGISGTLQALNLDISIHLVPVLSPSTSLETNDKDKVKQIWAVDLTDTRSNDPELDFRHKERVRAWDTCLYYSCGVFVCYDRPARVQRVALKDDARRETKILGPSDLEVLS